MYKIDKETNTFYLTRGDSAPFSIGIFDKYGNPYEPEEGDRVDFTVKPIDNLEGAPVIKKQGTTIKLVHEDTKNLPFGAYVYDVQITYANGDRDTVISPVKLKCGEKLKPNFYLLEEVNNE